MEFTFRTGKSKVEENAPHHITYAPFSPSQSKDPSPKGMVKTDSNFRKEWGEEHPFDFSLAEKTYKHTPIIKGAVDITVNSVVGSQQRIKCEDEGLKEILEDWMERNKFNLFLKTVCRDSLVYGTAFSETPSAVGVLGKPIVRDPKSIYIKRNEKGILQGYTQRLRDLGKAGIEEIIPFSTDEMAHFTLDSIGDGAYGTSLVASLMNTVETKLNLEESMKTIASRKANAPYVFTVGTPEQPPRSEDVSAVGQSLQYLTNKTEWVVPATVQVNALGFADKILDFNPFNEHFENQLIYGVQVPAVLLGQGNIPEGLAKAQMDQFEKRIVSIRLALEEVVKTRILDKVALANGSAGVKYSIEWEVESDEDKWMTVEKLMPLVDSFNTSDAVKIAAQKRIIQLLGLDVKEEEIDVPEQEPTEPFPETKKAMESIKESMNIQEFVGMPYKKVIRSILAFLDLYDFADVDLDQQSKEKLRDALKTGFAQGGSVSSLAKLINDKVFGGTEETRSKVIARTEAVRATNEGFLSSYKDRGVDNVRFIAVLDDRTDTDCEELDGQIFSIEEAQGMIPVHVSCRCRFTPIVG